MQIAQLLQLPRVRDIRQRLGKLPKGLDKAYDEIFKRIQDQEGNYPEIACRAFQWIMCSTRPLSAPELVVAVCQDPETDETDPIDISIEDVLAACHYLLVVDEELNTCRFSHLSVREYLKKHHWNDREANGLVAKVCLCLLNDPIHDVENIVDADDNSDSQDEEEEDYSTSRSNEGMSDYSASRTNGRISDEIQCDIERDSSREDGREVEVDGNSHNERMSDEILHDKESDIKSKSEGGARDYLDDSDESVFKYLTYKL